MKGKFKMGITTTKTAQSMPIKIDQMLDAEDSLKKALDAHWSWVCTMLYRLLGDWDDAEELALEVFYRLYRHPPRDNVGPWLYRVATNMGFNALRARKRRRRYEQEAGRLRLECASPESPSDIVERAETQQRVRQVLARMKPSAAKILVLRHSGLSYNEISQVLNVAPSSVGTLLARAERDFERRYRALEVDNETS